MQETKRRVLGILGGLGPMSSAYFYEMITAHTAAACDNEHMDIILSSRAGIPDRTDFILGISGNDPFPAMAEEVRKLTDYGATLIVIPCNTAHFFYDRLSRETQVPMLNMITQTVDLCARRGIRRLGIMATQGTVNTGLYSRACAERGIECVTPSEAGQSAVSSIIYDYIKAGRPAPAELVKAVENELEGQGCEATVIGCTELSLAKKQLGLGDWFVDSLQVLAHGAITAMGKTPTGFGDI